MPARRHIKVETRLDAAELARLDATARQLRLSRSELLRRCALNLRLPSAADFAAAEGIRDLLRVNADLARLGNLFRMAIDEPAAAGAADRIDRLIADIDVLRSELKRLAVVIDRQLRPPRNR